MKNTKILLAVMILFSLALGMCSAFTFGGDFNYVTSSGGIIHFSRDIAASKWSQQGALTRFDGIVWNGLGFLAVDAPTGTTVNFTGLQQRVLIYSVTDVGAGTQTINYRGLGEPSDITGGTYEMNGDNVVVTTAGNVIVTISWVTPLIQQANQIMGFLTIFAMVPIMLGAMGIRGVMNGTVNEDEFKNLILACAFVVLTIFVLGMIIKSMTGT